MLYSIATYAHGRIGAEIAYAAAIKQLGLRQLILSEPSAGGKDLYTKDGQVMVQARLLTKPGPLQPGRPRRTLRTHAGRMVRKLRQDFTYNREARVGYAVLSFLNPKTDSVVATILEVPNYH